MKYDSPSETYRGDEVYAVPKNFAVTLRSPFLSAFISSGALASGKAGAFSN
jgi:hypothetical protein